MLRSLNSGVTGLMNHQTRMDVIGNNISNVNTIGYKNRRVTFEESFNQVLKGASRTESKAGSTNPMQVGLGVALGSIDVITGQGTLNNTGRIFDIAIEGDAFFGVSDGEGVYYTRNGAFTLNSEGYITLPTNGMVLQGKMADSYGNFPAGTSIGNLQIPMSQQAPAKETTEIKLGGNLDSEGDAKGSVSYTQRMLHPADVSRSAGAEGGDFVGTLPANSETDPGKNTTSLTSLFNSKGQHLGIKENDVLTISWYDKASYTPSEQPTGKLSVIVGRQAGQIWDIDQFRAEIERAINTRSDGSPLGTNHQVTINSDGSFSIEYNPGTVTGTGTQIHRLQITSGNPDSQSYVTNAFMFPQHIGPAIGNLPDSIDPAIVKTDALLRPAEQFDVMANLRDGNGNKLYLGLDTGDTIDVSGSIGKTNIGSTKSNPLVFIPPNAIYDNGVGVNVSDAADIQYMREYRTWEAGYLNWVSQQPGGVPYPATAGTPDLTPAGYDDAMNAIDSDEHTALGELSIPANIRPADAHGGVFTVPDTYAPTRNVTLLDDLITKIRGDFKLPSDYVDRDGVHTPSVHMDTMDTDDGIPAGAIVIRGAKGTDFSINNLSIVASNSNSDETRPTYFNAVMGVTEKRKAEDVGHADVVIPVYDSTGNEHSLTITFVHTGKAGEWEWRASFGDKEIIVPGSGTGKVTFGQDGTVSSWIFDNGGSQLLVDPRNGANVMRINLAVGGPGDRRGINQADGSNTINTTGQDGYPAGNLTEITIDEFGIIEGSFSNGTSRKIAQMMMVDFANPGGLLDLSDSVYSTSANSGDPVWGIPVTQSSSKVKPGALEMSNVDLAGEFTNMITTQRGYQANSRIITVSDSMLEELVNLKR